MPKQLTESRRLVAEATPSGRLAIGLITPGWGTSGYYSAQVLENAAEAKVFKAGTQMFLDHPTESEMTDRPERSVRDLAAVLTSDATWDGTRLVGEAQVFGPYIDLLTDKDFASAIGVSIRALGEFTVGEAEGRQGRIITELVEAESVDFVTHAGRGGSILAVLESARPERVNARAVHAGVSEATANDTREALADAIKTAYGSQDVWLWVRDFDDTTVWYEQESPDSQAIWQQGYTITDQGAVTLDPARVEVVARVQYVPAPAAESGDTHLPAPAGGPTESQESEGHIMGHIQVDEGEHARLTEAAGRVSTLESERDEARRERDEAREALAARDREAAAARIIDAQASDAHVSFTALERRGLMAGMPVTESGQLDEEAFTEAARDAAAEKAADSGAGSIRGFGSTITDEGDQDVVKAAESAAASAFGRTIQEG